MEKDIKSLPESGSDAFTGLKTALIDSYTKRGLSAEVGVLENCTIKSSEELGSHVGGYLEVAVLTPDNILYIHPDLTRPEKFALAEAVVRFELSYAILGIHLVNPTEMDFRKATAAIRSRLTSDELKLLRTFNLSGTAYAMAEEAKPDNLKEVTNKAELTDRRDWKARAKSFIDNDLFVDFDEPTDEPLTEAAPTTARAIINRYNDNVADHILELEHENAFEDAEWFEDGWYTLENVEVEPDYYKLIVDRPIESDVDAEAIIAYAFEPANIVGMDEAMSEGGVVYDEGDNWIYVERWVIE
jgi:hypothetical protein